MMAVSRQPESSEAALVTSADGDPNKRQKRPHASANGTKASQWSKRTEKPKAAPAQT